jgi:hypothetical protein
MNTCCNPEFTEEYSLGVTLALVGKRAGGDCVLSLRPSVQ